MGNFNTALGKNAGSECTFGYYNICIGAHVKGLAEDTNTIRIGTPYDPTQSVPFGPAGQNRTFIAGIVESPLSPSDALGAVGITSEGRLGTIATESLQGPPGEGLVSGSLLFLRSGVTPPAGYSLLGTTSFSLTTSGSKKPTVITVHVYQKQ